MPPSLCRFPEILPCYVTVTGFIRPAPQPRWIAVLSHLGRHRNHLWCLDESAFSKVALGQWSMTQKERSNIMLCICFYCNSQIPEAALALEVTRMQGFWSIHYLDMFNAFNHYVCEPEFISVSKIRKFKWERFSARSLSASRTKDHLYNVYLNQANTVLHKFRCKFTVRRELVDLRYYQA